MKSLLLLFILSSCGPSVKQVAQNANAEQTIERHEQQALQALITGDIYPELRVQACKQAMESARQAADLRRKPGP